VSHLRVRAADAEDIVRPRRPSAASGRRLNFTVGPLSQVLPFSQLLSPPTTTSLI
jgi:hypothetical protein